LTKLGKTILTCFLRHGVQNNVSLDRVSAKLHVNPSNNLSRMHECDKKETTENE